MDAERVMQFLVNRLKVNGPIGVYGRSIGGISAAHLAHKFPKIVKVFVGDRTLGIVDNIVKQKVKDNSTMLKIYRIMSCFWRIDNSIGLSNNP